MSNFEQKEVLFKHTDKLSEAIDKSRLDWQENTIYFVEDNINKKGTIFLNGIPYSPTTDVTSELVGYTFQNVKTGKYISRSLYPYVSSSGNVTSLLTGEAVMPEIFTFSNGANFAGIPANPKRNNIIASTSNMYFNYQGTPTHFTLHTNPPVQTYICMYAVNNYDDTTLPEDIYYLWKHNNVGCGILIDSEVDGVSFVDLQDNGNASFETRDGFIWSVPEEERTQYQWRIKPVYRTKTQWTPRGTYSQQESYVAGDVVSYNNSLYLCLLNYDASNVPFLNPDETTAKSYWAEVFKAEKSSYRGEYKFEKDGLYNVNDVVIVGTTIYMCTNTYTMDDETASNPTSKIHWAEILYFPTPKESLLYRGDYSIGDIDNPKSYNKNDIATSNESQYICVQSYTTPSEAFDGGGKFIPTINNLAWIKTDTEQMIFIPKYEVRGYKNKSYYVNDVIKYTDGFWYKCILKYNPVRHQDVTPLDTTYWERITNINEHLTEEGARALTRDDIVSMSGQRVLYKNLSTPMDVRGLEICDLYRCTGVVSELANPYSTPFNSIQFGLPYWKLFAIMSPVNKIKVSYLELTTLLNAGRLDTQMEYILTDYNIDETFDKNAHHNFYIVLTAADNHTLNKKCSFMVDPEHADYFKNCDLDKWTGEYILNNDDTVHIYGCNGTIVYMIDEFNNECNFDFKNALDDLNHYAFTRKYYDAEHLQVIHDSTICSNNVKNNTCLTYGASSIVIYDDDSVVENVYFNLSKEDLNADEHLSRIGLKNTITIDGGSSYNINISHLSNHCDIIIFGDKFDLDSRLFVSTKISNIDINNVSGGHLYLNMLQKIHIDARNYCLCGKSFLSEDIPYGNITIHDVILDGQLNISNGSKLIIKNSTIDVIDGIGGDFEGEVINSYLSLSGEQMGLSPGANILNCDINNSDLRLSFGSNDMSILDIARLTIVANYSKIYKRFVNPKINPEKMLMNFDLHFDEGTSPYNFLDLKFQWDRCECHREYINVEVDDSKIASNQRSYIFDPSINSSVGSITLGSNVDSHISYDEIFVYISDHNTLEQQSRTSMLRKLGSLS